MSAADEAWRGWLNSPEQEFKANHDHASFMAGYVRALEDAAQQIRSAIPYGYGMNPDGTEDRTAMAYVDGNGEALNIVQAMLRDVAPRETKD